MIKLLGFILLMLRVFTCNAQDSVFTNLDQALLSPEKVKILILKKEKLTTFPDSALRAMSNLKELDLSRNRIKELPQDLSYLSKLKVLNLSSNRLTQLSAGIGQLTDLENLDCSSNDLSALPSALFDLNKIRELILYANSLESISERVGEFKQLEVLDVRGNQLKFLSKSELKSWLGEGVKLRKSNGCNC